MSFLGTLFFADLQVMSIWFRTERIGKIAVAAAFFALLAGIAYVIWAVSGIFFRNLVPFDNYGKMTADYIIHAAIVITVWIGIASSCAAAVTLNSQINKNREYLYSLPVPSVYIILYDLIRTFCTNMVLLSVVFIPIVISYASSFGYGLVTSIPIALFVLCLLSIMTSSLGNLLSSGINFALTKFMYGFMTLGFFVFLGGMIGLLKIIFPQNLFTLYSASTVTFQSAYASLPLNSPYLPSYWLAGIVTQGVWQYALLALIITSVLFLASLLVSLKRFPYEYGSVWTTRKENGSLRVFRYSAHGIIVKDALSIIRVPSELGYAIFLISLSVFFFGVLSVLSRVERVGGTWNAQIITFVFAWVIFFSICFAMRFLFPLFAKEGPEAWHIFTVPVRRRNIISQKFLFGFIETMPVILFASVVWLMMPFAGNHTKLLIAVTIWSIFSVSSVTILTGMIFPNFREGNSPEQVSTSLMGIVTLLIILILSAYYCYILFSVLSTETALLRGVISLGVIGGIIVTGTYVCAMKAVKLYEF